MFTRNGLRAPDPQQEHALLGLHRLSGGDVGMLDRWSPELRMVTLHAREETLRAGQSDVGTEHILLGTIAAGGPTGSLLLEVGAEPERIRESLRRPAQEHANVSRTGYTIRARHALRLADGLTLRLGHPMITPTHLLWATLSIPDSHARAALEVPGVSQSRLHRGISELMAFAEQTRVSG